MRLLNCRLLVHRLTTRFVMILVLLSACSRGGSGETGRAIDDLVAKYQASSDASRYRPGDVIQFGRDGNAARYQASGWSVPEDGFTWALGNRSILSIPLEMPFQKEVLATIRAWPLLMPPQLQAQTVQVSANGIQVGVWTMTGRGMQQQTFRIPKIALRSARELTLVLDLPQAASPKSVGYNDDPRVLSVAFVEIQLKQ